MAEGQQAVSQEVIEQVMDKIENFYFDDSEQGGEHMFKQFAEKHAHLFDENCDAENVENKLE